MAHPLSLVNWLKLMTFISCQGLVHHSTIYRFQQMLPKLYLHKVWLIVWENLSNSKIRLILNVEYFEILLPDILLTVTCPSPHKSFPPLKRAAGGKVGWEVWYIRDTFFRNQKASVQNTRMLASHLFLYNGIGDSHERQNHGSGDGSSLVSARAVALVRFSCS